MLDFFEKTLKAGNVRYVKSFGVWAQLPPQICRKETLIWAVAMRRDPRLRECCPYIEIVSLRSSCAGILPMYQVKRFVRQKVVLCLHVTKCCVPSLWNAYFCNLIEGSGRCAIFRPNFLGCEQIACNLAFLSECDASSCLSTFFCLPVFCCNPSTIACSGGPTLASGCIIVMSAVSFGSWLAVLLCGHVRSQFSEED